tara:strand:- start:1342 stop:1455 length:114 start_codon:yes stop_codon:yes gene_type:complete
MKKNKGLMVKILKIGANISLIPIAFIQKSNRRILDKI